VATLQANPKHLTHKGLRQLYSSQPASRPQEDVDGEEAKVADTGHGEVDRPPGIIEWDGTKITTPNPKTTAADAHVKCKKLRIRQRKTKAISRRENAVQAREEALQVREEALQTREKNAGLEDNKKKGREDTVEGSLTLSAAPGGLQGKQDFASSSPVSALVETQRGMTAFQKRMMKAKADIVAKHRREEKARQVAERKGKIKLRGEKLGLGGDKKGRHVGVRESSTFSAAAE
jgi:hypothetical protein